MTGNEHPSPIPVTARLKVIEITDTDKLEDNRSYFMSISVDGNIVVQSEKKRKSKGDPNLRWEWEGREFGVHPSSTIAIRLYRLSGLPLIKAHFVGEHCGKIVELVHQDDNTFNLKNEKGPMIKIIIALSIAPAPNEELEDFMKFVDASIFRLNSAGQMGTSMSIIGTALQFTKNIMHIVADAHPILKVSWTFLSAVYTAIEMVELQDESVRDLAEELKELLALSNQHRNLLIVKGTENVTDAIGRMSLTVTSLIYEYAKPKFGQRAIALQLSDDLRKRITDCRKSCIDLRKKFKMRISIETNELAREIKDINAKIQHTLETVKDDHLADKIWKWLSAPDSSLNFYAAMEKHQEGTFDWFLDGKWFRNYQAEVGFLWIKGTAGCGKTVLCSSIIDKMIQLFEEKQNSSSEAYAYFFFDGRDSQKDLQLHDKLIRSLIWQLSTHCDGIPLALVNLYHARGHQQPSIRLLQETLNSVMEGFDSVYIVIDSLDECVDREKTLIWIQGIISHQVGQNLHLVVASRPEHDINIAFQSPYISSVNLVNEVDKDIVNYLNEKLRLLTRWDDEIRENVKSTLREGAEGMFRWVALQLIELQKCSNKTAVLKQLQNLPRGLFRTYDQILSKIDKETDSTDVKTFLRLLSFSIRSMSLQEIAAAAAVEFNENNGPRYEPLREYWDAHDVLKKCSGLITDSGNGTAVKLAHFSVKEYLLSDHLLSGPMSSYHLSSAEHAHSIISQTCLAYLLQFDRGDSLKNDFLKSSPLAVYAAKHWISHIHSAINVEESELSALWTLAYELFNPSGTTWINWVRIWNGENPSGMRNLQRPITAPPLYYASLAGLAPVIHYLLEKRADVNLVEGKYGCALQGAAYNGHIEVIEVLLANGAVVNLVGGEYGHALQAASFRGEIHIINLLLANGADLNLVGGKYGTALQAAVIGDKETIIELLLQRGADVNRVGGEYGTALQAAVVSSQYAMVELLLEKGANANLVGGTYGSALQAASRLGHAEIVDLLFKKGADANLVGPGSGSALQMASLGHRYAIVELLLKNGADVNHVGGKYGTALQAASVGGQYATAKLLLEKGADVNRVGGEYDTALYAASFCREVQIVELLLKHGADVNLEGGDHGSALHGAARSGITKIVEMLLENGAEINLEGGEDGSALQAASRWGCINIVELLLREGAAVNLAGGRYGSALQAASQRGSANIVELLLKNGAEVNLEGGQYGSALQAALYMEHAKTIELLLENGADINLASGQMATV